MIEVVQQVAQGTQNAINMYKVYRHDGLKRDYLGWCIRGEGAVFNPYREYTDTDKKSILAAVNAYMQENGYPLVKRYGTHGMTQAQVESLLHRITPQSTTEEDDDE